MQESSHWHLAAGTYSHSENKIAHPLQDTSFEYIVVTVDFRYKIWLAHTYNLDQSSYIRISTLSTVIQCRTQLTRNWA